jgi:hypothetical protein
MRLVDVATFAPSNAWAIGVAQTETPQDTARNEAVLLHWNGKSWKPTQINGVASAGFLAG